MVANAGPALKGRLGEFGVQKGWRHQIDFEGMRCTCDDGDKITLQMQVRVKSYAPASHFAFLVGKVSFVRDGR